jgi:hypothetical protein
MFGTKERAIAEAKSSNYAATLKVFLPSLEVERAH